MAMANAEQATLAAAIDEIGNSALVEVAEEVAEQRGRMRVVMNTLMGRVYSETHAKLEMHAALEDKDMYYEAVVRCCSEEALNDDVYGPEPPPPVECRSTRRVSLRSTPLYPTLLGRV